MEAPPRRAHGRDLRKGRRSISGQVYLITLVTAARSHEFEDLWRARTAIRCLHEPNVSRRAETLAYVVMPDHIHWLLQLSDVGTLAAVVRLYKAKVSRQLGRGVWQRGYHDRALRAEDDVVAVSRYIVANPLRAGLAKTVGEYPHWDAVWLTGTHNHPL